MAGELCYQAPQGPAVAKGCRGLPQGLSLPARSFSRAAWYRQKLPLSALAGREQFDSSACFVSWHGRSRWEDILAQLEESVHSLGVFVLSFFFKPQLMPLILSRAAHNSPPNLVLSRPAPALTQDRRCSKCSCRAG